MAEAEAWVMIPKMDKDKTGCVIDMRPLVLCKDCIFAKSDLENAVWCERDDCRRHENWFCADGERRNDNV